MIDSKLITELVGDLKETELLDLISNFIDSNPTKKEALLVIDACQEGMSTVGELFEDGKYFIGDVIFAGELQKQIYDQLRPIIGEYNTKSNEIVLGTVYGKSHNVGKNIFMNIVKAAGYEVVQEKNCKSK
ncbi:hypothetical protein GC105_14990 [Alkalibaculum sp. M08DMB]|uniref:B12-binding N-terminal domain-containing protein n=1 Tax=Alkalibaculum sporogenes TaxID=2655001 RepID=A0A6A7KCG5_9FIRM|nr:B12-binding domain-containing protein [Alkalibaculum sporogenes]MPW27086.1 hypothetical protein [Alkalibaculum sporogenes]